MVNRSINRKFLFETMSVNALITLNVTLLKKTFHFRFLKHCPEDNVICYRFTNYRENPNLCLSNPNY